MYIFKHKSGVDLLILKKGETIFHAFADHVSADRLIEASEQLNEVGPDVLAALEEYAYEDKGELYRYSDGVAATGLKPAKEVHTPRKKAEGLKPAKKAAKKSAK